MYLKRNNFKTFWPIPRKGTKYLATATHNKGESIPLIVIVRDIFQLVETKKELKKVISEKKIKVNQKVIRETNYPVCLFDIISFSDSKKNYRAIFSRNRKMIFEEVKEKDAETKIFKVMNKKVLSGKKVQLNLMHGRNIISKEKINPGDSVVLNLKDNKVIKVIPLEKGKSIFVIKGKHIGAQGEIKEIISRGGKKIAKIILKEDKGKSLDSHKISVWTKNIIAI